MEFWVYRIPLSPAQKPHIRLCPSQYGTPNTTTATQLRCVRGDTAVQTASSPEHGGSKLVFAALIHCGVKSGGTQVAQPGKPNCASMFTSSCLLFWGILGQAVCCSSMQMENTAGCAEPVCAAIMSQCLSGKLGGHKDLMMTNIVGSSIMVDHTIP